MDKAVEKYDLRGSTFDGDTQALFARYYQMNQKVEKALKFADRAIAIFDKADDGYISQFAYLVYIYKGHSHRGIAQKTDDPNHLIKAGLAYQTVMTNAIGTLPDTHPFIQTATIRWINMRKDIEAAGILEQAQAEGLCHLNEDGPRKFKAC